MQFVEIIFRSQEAEFVEDKLLIKPLSQPIGRVCRWNIRRLDATEGGIVFDQKMKDAFPIVFNLALQIEYAR